MLGVESNHALAGGAGGGLDAYALLQRLAHQAVGVGHAQVILGDEGQLMQIVPAFDVIRGYALFFHLLAVIGHVVPDVLYLRDKALVLPGFDLFLRRAFDFRLIVTFHKYPTPFQNGDKQRK